MADRDVRMQEFGWPSSVRPLVLLGDVGKWSMVRRADFPTAVPFVISRKEWDKLPTPSLKGTTP